MANIWNTNIPLVTNQVAEDIADINENFTYMKAMMTNQYGRFDASASDISKQAFYFADPDEADQGATGDGASIKALADTIGASKNAVIVLPHRAADGNTTSYALGTSLTLGTNIRLQIEPGASIAVATGKTITLYSPEHLLAGKYQVFAFTGTGNAAFTTGGTGYVAWFGTDTTAIQRAFDAMPSDETTESPWVLVFSPGVTYTVTTAITKEQLPHHCKVIAYGANFTGTYDGIWFQIHDADKHGTTTHFVTQFSWFGGRFTNTGTSSASIGLMIHNNRYGIYEGMEWIGFWKAYWERKSENCHIRNNRFYDCVYGVWSDAPIDGTNLTQNLTIEHNAFSNVGTGLTPVNAIRITGRANGIKIVRNTFGWKVAAGQAAVHFNDADPSDVGSVSGHGHIISENHFEQLIAMAIKFDNPQSMNFKNIEISNNTFSSPQQDTPATLTIIDLEGVFVAYIKNNYLYAHSTNTVTGISLDAGCRAIHITSPNSTAYGWEGIDTTVNFSCTRGQITFDPNILKAHIVLTGWNAAAKSTGTATIDVLGNAAMANYIYDGIAPKAYWVTIRGRDSASSSAAAGACSISLRDVAGTNAIYGAYVDCGNIANDAWVTDSRLIACASDGSLYIDIAASGSGTMDVTVVIDAILR